MNQRITPWLVVVLAALVAACSSNESTSVGSAVDDPASVTILTTTTSVSTTTVPRPSTVPAAGTSAPTDTTALSDTTSPPTRPPSPAPTTTVAPTTTDAPARVGDPVVASEPISDFERPIDLAVRPGDDRLYVVEQSGRVVRYDGIEQVTMLDIVGRVSSRNEQGLLGLVFSPDGTRAYVNFTDRSDDTIIAEFAVGTDGVFDPTSERLVLQVDQPFPNHNAGDLAFGPDGMLYVPLGDGGSGGDPERNGSNPATLLGSLLRIDPTPGEGSAYTIPPDNPFADGGPGAPEVWAWGLRNPWKIAFDPLTNELWIPDVGQNEFEEINVVGPVDGVTAGRAVDFGWSAFEGTERFNGDVADSGAMMPPVLTYGRADGCSISGGIPYRGIAIPELEPAFLYSDYCNGTIWALDLAGGRSLTLLGGFDNVAAVRVGPDSEPYVLERSGTIHRLIAG